MVKECVDSEWMTEEGEVRPVKDGYQRKKWGSNTFKSKREDGNRRVQARKKI